MTEQRRIDGKRLVVATHNNGKLREFYFPVYVHLVFLSESF